MGLSNHEAVEAAEYNYRRAMAGGLRRDDVPTAVRLAARMAAGGVLTSWPGYLRSPNASRVLAASQLAYGTTPDGQIGPLTVEAFRNQRPRGAVLAPYRHAWSIDRWPELQVQLDVEAAHFQPLKIEPYSDEAVDLFRHAARLAELPEAWADDEDLHYVMRAESAGLVGVPNYTYDRVYGINLRNNRSLGWAFWPVIHADLRGHVMRAKSSATGLGQMLLGNMMKHAPHGARGIGDPLEEAVAMLCYIQERYLEPSYAGRYHRLPVDPKRALHGYNWRAVEQGVKKGEGY
jgi:hypothetical protein